MHARLLPDASRLPGVAVGWAGLPAPQRTLSGVPLFVGFAHARLPRPLRLERWDDWVAAAGGRGLAFLEPALRGFFENGGLRCWVWALPVPAPADAPALAAALLDVLRPAGPLEDLEEPDLVCVPDAVAPPLGHDGAAVARVQAALLAHCRRCDDRLALLDCLPAGGLRPRVAGSGFGDAAFGALYWPWVRVHAAGGRTPSVPPCGHVAGVIARLDAAPGRHKAPANELLEGVHDVDETASPALAAELFEQGVNLLQVRSGRGVAVGGARTLSDRPSLRPLHARRVVLGFVRWSRSGLRDLVFEPQTPALWERIRQRVLAWCRARHAEGALRGDTATQAYFVKCDAETNPAPEREAGRVVCRVGLAACTPAEFIVIQLVSSPERAVPGAREGAPAGLPSPCPEGAT